MEKTEFSCGDIVKVVLPLASDGYDYIVPENLELCVGDFVRVPLRNKEEVGVVFSEKKESLDYDISRVRKIISKVKNYKLLPTQIEFVLRVADYNLTQVGNVLKMVMGFDEVFSSTIPRVKKTNYNPTYVSPELSPEQKNAVDVLSKKLGAGFSVSLLDGITGSGKTEVYFNVINEALKKPEAQVLIMLPEI